ncbi:MAG TPA: hypothetical protein VLL98_04265 [Rickettsiales bacterium]|nr:hypothetical protein [Rickettsiales bacterium]
MQEKKFIEKIKKQIENAPLEYKSFPIKVKDLERYNQLYPKATKIILQDFERISINKVEHQKQQLEAQIKLDKISQWQGFFVSIFMIISALICGILGREIIASALIGVSSLGLVKAILPFKGKNKDNNKPSVY